MSRFVRLGELLKKLSALPQDSRVRVAAPIGLVLTGDYCSYRGFYEDLALEVHQSDSSPMVAELLPKLRRAVGDVVYGWKGGEFRIDENSRVWLANAGTSSGARVTGIKQDEYVAYITYEMAPDDGHDEARVTPA